MLLGVCALLASDSAIKRIFTGRQKSGPFRYNERVFQQFPLYANSGGID